MVSERVGVRANVRQSDVGDRWWAIDRWRSKATVATRLAIGNGEASTRYFAPIKKR